MFLPSPEAISKIHSTVLEVEGLFFNVLLFCRFARDEIRAIFRGVRLRRGCDSQERDGNRLYPRASGGAASK